MSSAHSPRLRRGCRTAALLMLALFAAPVAALAHDAGSSPSYAARPDGRAGRTFTETREQLHRPGAGIRSNVTGGADVSAACAQTDAGTGPTLAAAAGACALRNLQAPPAIPDAGVMAAAAPTLSRHLLFGSGVGAAAGAAFGLAVVSLADCGGPDCTEERVVGVAGTALAGAAVGALVGGVTYLFRR